MSEKDLRRLVIKAFHMDRVMEGEENRITPDGLMTINKGCAAKMIEAEPLIENVGIRVIPPGGHDCWTNTIMDIIPGFDKGCWGSWEKGFTHTLSRCLCCFDRSGYGRKTDT